MISYSVLTQCVFSVLYTHNRTGSTSVPLHSVLERPLQMVKRCHGIITTALKNWRQIPNSRHCQWCSWSPGGMILFRNARISNKIQQERVKDFVFSHSSMLNESLVFGALTTFFISILILFSPSHAYFSYSVSLCSGISIIYILYIIL